MNDRDESEWESTMTMICQLGCNCISWAPFRPGTSQNASILRVAIGGADGYVHIMEWVWRGRTKSRCAQSVENGWEFESKLRGQKEQVRDVAWSPQIGDSMDVIASCGRVNNWKKNIKNRADNCWFGHENQEKRGRKAWIKLTQNRYGG